MAKKSVTNWRLIGLQLAILLGVIAIVYFYAQPQQQDAGDIPNQASVRSVRPIPPDSQTYKISGKFPGPQISELTVNPLDAKTGETQDVWVKASDLNPITSVVVTVTLDTPDKAQVANLSLSEGTDLQGTWQGAISFPNDTMNRNYTVKVEATSLTGTSKTVITIR